MRVVSLVPSVTETLLAWGVEPVAVTRFCEQPRLPTVGGTKDPDIGSIVRLSPDLVVMNDEENRREDADALRAAGVDVHVVTVRAVEEVAAAFAGLARRLGINAGVEGVEGVAAVEDLGPAHPRAARVFVPIWRRPWMSLNRDTYGSSLLEWCGAVNVLAGHDERYPTVAALDAVRDTRPDLVLAPSEPYPFAERHRPELEVVAPVVFVDGRDLFWWGHRTAAAADRLFRVITGGLARSAGSA